MPRAHWLVVALLAAACLPAPDPQAGPRSAPRQGPRARGGHDSRQRSPRRAREDRVLAIRAGKILTMTGAPLRPGVILVRDGRIVAVGRHVDVPPGARVIDAGAEVVMPGLVAAHTSLGERTDSEETVTPELRAVESFDFYAERRALLEGGITTAYVAPGSRRLVGGQGAVVKLAGASPARRTLRAAADVRVVLGDPSKGPPPLFRPPIPPTSDTPILPAQRQLPSARPSQMALLRQLLLAARSRMPGGSAAGHPRQWVASASRLRSLHPVLAGSAPLRVSAHRAGDIERALALAGEFRTRLVLEGATEGYRVARALARRRVPVILHSPARPGRSVGDDFTRPSAQGAVRLSNAARLKQAGVRLALAVASDEELPDLLAVAAAAAQNGLSREAALRAITLDAAEILGVARRVGSIALGKDADLVILDDDPLRTRARVLKTLVDGEVVFSREPGVAKRDPLLAIHPRRILTVTRGAIDGGTVLLRGGRIAAVTHERVLPEGARVLEATRGVVIPGMIDAHSHIGLHAEADPAPLVPPSPTTGTASARTRLLNALVPRDPAFGEALRAGITTVLLAPPTAGQVCGQCALLGTAACPRHLELCPERVVREYAALCFNMQGGSPRMAQPWNFRDLLQRAKEYLRRRADYLRERQEWERAYEEARSQGKPPPKEPAEVSEDEDLEPFGPLFRGEVQAFVHVSRSDEILNALRVFVDEFELRVALVDAGDGDRVAAEVRRRGAAAALGPCVTRRERGKLVNVAESLAVAGVPVLFHCSATSGTQFLRLNAAYAVRGGLDPVEALRALTIYPARALGVADRLGSIEVGKQADLVVLDGDPLELASRVRMVLVNGKVVFHER